MLDGAFRSHTIRRLRQDISGGVRRLRQRVIRLEEHQPRYCLRPPAMAEVMPWDDGPEITEVDESSALSSLDR